MNILRPQRCTPTILCVASQMQSAPPRLNSSPLSTDLVPNVPKPARRRTPHFRCRLSFSQHIQTLNNLKNFSHADRTYRLQEYTGEHRTNKRPLDPIQIHPTLTLIKLCVHRTVRRNAAMLCGPIRWILTRLRWCWVGVQTRVELLV